MAFNHTYPYRAGYGSFYPFASRSSGYALQQYQDESDLLGFGTSPFQTPEAAGILNPNMNSMQDMDSANYGLCSESPTVESPLVTPVPLFSSQRNHSKILSPSAQRVAHIQLQKLLEIESLNEPNSPVPVVEKSPFCSDMPIGSLVHFQGPHEWGVVKIANVSPYFSFSREMGRMLIPSNTDPVLHHKAGNYPVPWSSGSPGPQRPGLRYPYNHGALDGQDHGLLR